MDTKFLRIFDIFCILTLARGYRKEFYRIKNDMEKNQVDRKIASGIVRFDDFDLLPSFDFTSAGFLKSCKSFLLDKIKARWKYRGSRFKRKSE